jgi:hypothetical protein
MDSKKTPFHTGAVFFYGFAKRPLIQPVSFIQGCVSLGTRGGLIA